MIQFFGADFTEKDVDFSLIQIKNPSEYCKKS